MLQGRVVAQHPEAVRVQVGVDVLQGHRALGQARRVWSVGLAEPFDRWTWGSDDATTETVVLDWTKMLVAARYLFDRPDGADPGVAC